jgi:hypothetical protein
MPGFTIEINKMTDPQEELEESKEIGCLDVKVTRAIKQFCQVVLEVEE